MVSALSSLREAQHQASEAHADIPELAIDPDRTREALTRDASIDAGETPRERELGLAQDAVIRASERLEEASKKLARAETKTAEVDNRLASVRESLKDVQIDGSTKAERRVTELERVLVKCQAELQESRKDHDEKLEFVQPLIVRRDELLSMLHFVSELRPAPPQIKRNRAIVRQLISAAAKNSQRMTWSRTNLQDLWPNPEAR